MWLGRWGESAALVKRNSARRYAGRPLRFSSDGLLRHLAGRAERMTYTITQVASILACLTSKCMRARTTLMSLSKGSRGCTARSYQHGQK
jgi:hypothetical protein